MGVVHATHMAELTKTVPLYPPPNSGLFLAVEEDHCVGDRVESPRGFDKGNSSGKPAVLSSRSPGASSIRSVQQGGNDDSVEALHLRC